MNNCLPGGEVPEDEVERLEVLFVNNCLPGGEVSEDEVERL